MRPVPSPQSARTGGSKAAPDESRVPDAGAVNHRVVARYPRTLAKHSELGFADGA